LGVSSQTSLPVHGALGQDAPIAKLCRASGVERVEVREVLHCAKCGQHYDRDHAAAHNILELVLAELQGTMVDPRFCGDAELTVRKAITQSGCVQGDAFVHDRALSFVQTVRTELFDAKQRKKLAKQATTQSNNNNTQSNTNNQHTQSQQQQQQLSDARPLPLNSADPKPPSLVWALRRFGVRDVPSARCSSSAVANNHNTQQQQSNNPVTTPLLSNSANTKSSSLAWALRRCGVRDVRSAAGCSTSAVDISTY